MPQRAERSQGLIEYGLGGACTKSGSENACLHQSCATQNRETLHPYGAKIAANWPSVLHSDASARVRIRAAAAAVRFLQAAGSMSAYESVIGKELWSAKLEGGEHWSGILRRGASLRLKALEERANVAALMYHFGALSERYNMADTLKAQHTAYLTAGCVCYSDMGRILCSITVDSCGWHDTICGLTDAASISKKYGATRYQEQRNGFHKNGRDSVLNELGKYGLGKRDLIANINFFSRVSVDEHGVLQFHERHCGAGDYVELRFEMDTLLILASTPHPLDPLPQYQPRPIALRAWVSGAAPVHDPCRERCPENGRGFQNTEMMFL